MPKPFVQLTIAEFAEKLRSFRFTRPVTAVHMHHTWSPTKATYAGLATIEGMWAFHTQTNGWSDIAQHLSIAPDGTVWTGRDWNRTPASATGFNTGVFMFETIGNFDVGHEQLTGAQRRAVIEVIARVQLKCGLPLESLHFHREFTDVKTCPGTGVKKAEILEEVRAARARLDGSARDFLAAAERGATAEDVSDPLARPFADRELSTAEPPEEGEVDCAGVAGRAAVDVGVGDGARGGGALTPDDLSALRPYVVNLSQGRFSSGGALETSPGDVDAIFLEHLPRALGEAREQNEPLRIVFWAHGGLVDEASGLQMAHMVVPWWVQNRVYPIYFIWETGFWETILQLIGRRRELAAARDLFDLTDPPLEELARKVGGGKIWDGMKQSAQRSVEDDGGAQYVARRLAEFCAKNQGTVELHAAGHSAGSIFHSYFLPAARGEGAPAFRSLSFLAPAIRVREFLDRVVPMLGPGGGIEALTMFTMNKNLERADNCGSIYRKSLLYLVHNALEARRGEPILGLEESIRAEPLLAPIFGLGGNARTVNEIVWSKTSASSGRSASRSTTHGGFDNDRRTMESVMRRVRGASDTDWIEPFPAEAARAFSFDATLGDVGAASAERPAPPAAAAPVAPVPDLAVQPLEIPRPSRPPASPLPTSTTPAGMGARLTRALCVGINKYPGRNELHGCVADANAWAAAFRTLGFQRVDIVTDQQATHDRVRDELAALVKAGLPGDALVFQYSGHGTFFQDRDGDEPDHQDEAIVPVDFGSGQFILDDEIFEIFDDLADGVSLTCFFDCCHSGTISRVALTTALREMSSDDALPRFIDPTPEMWAEYRARRSRRRALGAEGKRDAESNKAVVFSACRDEQVALERGGHGVFTTCVAPILGDAFTAAMSNELFQRRIDGAFGQESSQNPVLDCATRARSWPLLRRQLTLVETAAPIGPPGHDGKKEETAKAWNALLGSLYTMEPGAVQRLIEQAQAILSQSRTG